MNVEPDPKKPYKAYMAAVVAMLGTLAGYGNVLPLWVGIIIAVVLSGLATFYVPNPPRTKVPKDSLYK